MRHHSGSDLPRRAAISLVVVASLVAVFAGAQLLRGEPAESSASAPADDGPGSTFLDSDSSYDKSDEDKKASDKPVGHTPSTTTLLSAPDVYANPQGPARRLRVTLTLTSDGPIYEAYDFRDGKRAGPRVVDKHLTVSRTLRGPLPVARLGAQVMTGATYVTCRIIIDGTVIAEDTAHGPGYVAACVG